MSRIRVLVVAPWSLEMPPDLLAEGICAEACCHDDIHLVEGRVLRPGEVSGQLRNMPPDKRCALILIGPFDHTAPAAKHWLKKHANLVVLRVAVGQNRLRIAARNLGMGFLLNAVRDLVDRGRSHHGERLSEIQLPPPADADCLPDEPHAVPIADPPVPASVMNAAIDWIHVHLRAALKRLIAAPPGEASVAVTSASIADFLERRDPRTPMIVGHPKIDAADKALTRALAVAVPRAEPLARAARALELPPFEFRMVVLALGPELDPRYQRWISLLMDDAGRRVGTLGLYEELLGVSAELSAALARSGRLARWRLFEAESGCLPAADEPLRLDPPFRAWLLGAPDALAEDPALRRILRFAPWPGASLIDEPEGCEPGERLLDRLQHTSLPWTLLVSDAPAACRALIEADAAASLQAPLRADLARLGGLDVADVAETAIRLARLARISARPLILDASNAEDGREQDEALRAFFETLGGGGAPAAIITAEPARIVRLLGAMRYAIEQIPQAAASRSAALRRAGEAAGVCFSEETAESLANLYPLQIDGIEQALRLARARPLADDSEEARRIRFITACKEVSAEGASGLAQRIEPAFDLPDVVLPPDRKDQLEEIVHNVRLAPKVLEDWKFREQLPYGLGVTALFHGPSGTGKTMAAMAVARTLGVQILRIDLSRVVSKYIGDTEKNIDRIFLEAQSSGAALLIDEADSLMARRSDVKDAHDRYANIEVAYLLQRMEAYDGLAILTTNLRQNIDGAFLRRLRFIIDFPRPDAAAREEIWRRCLPSDSHELGDAAFRQLGRKIELTGGSIRQITLRAAFVAAAAGTKIGPEHIAHACRAEFAKLGLPPVELDLVERCRAA